MAMDFLSAAWAKMKLEGRKTHEVGFSSESSGQESLKSEIKPVLRKGNLNLSR